MLDFRQFTYSRPTTKIDRYHSRPLDVHLWSDHPEVKDLTQFLYDQIDASQLEKIKGKRPRKRLIDQLRVLVLDLYVCWFHNPNQAIGLHRNKSRYKVGSRYNQLRISDKVIQIVALMIDHGFLEELPGYYDGSGRGRSYCTCIRPLAKLHELFEAVLVDEFDVLFNFEQETVVLRDEDGENIEYIDDEHTIAMRKMLRDYNALLLRSSIDIPDLIKPVITYTVESGKDKNRKINVPIGRSNKFVYRVFSRRSFSLNGRFTGGFWQFVPKAYRSKIYINGEPTVELDYSGLHINILSLRKGVAIEKDPYNLGNCVLPGIDADSQRQCVKSLLLVAINAKNKKDAFAAFRDDNRRSNIGILRDSELLVLLEAFLAKHPHLRDDVCADRGISLMNIDSQMAECIIMKFVEMDIPILCVHDSFIVQERHQGLLHETMMQVSKDVLGEAVTVKTKYPDQGHITEQYINRLHKQRMINTVTNL